MSTITVVSAFYDINRDSFSTYKRSKDKYLEYFSFWARLRNDLVVFTQKAFKDKIIEIRNDFGLGGNTRVIVIDDIESIEANLFSKMENISKSDYFRKYRFYENATSNNAKYSYLMFLKAWFVKEAKKYFDSDFYAWLDFGYNHGGVYLIILMILILNGVMTFRKKYAYSIVGT